jgi:histidinol-phosphate aminotransferase
VSAPVARPGVMMTAAYVPGERAIQGVAAPIKLSSNESPHGPGARALEAYQRVAADLFRYPNSSQDELRRAVAQVHGLDPARLVFGNGSDEVIQMLTRAYVGPGDEVVLSEHCFLMAKTHALAQGAKVQIAPEPDCRINVDEILSRITPMTRLVAIASPNNPCGTYLPRAGLQRLHAALPQEVILLVDAAYSEYATAADYDNGAGLAASAPNVIMTRTFSKLYGLAGLRVGWGFASPEIIGALEHVRSPFNVNAVAQAVAAAAVSDREHAAYVCAYNARERERVSSACRALGITVVPSSANFVLLVFGEEPHTAAKAHALLLANGIIPRPLGGAPANSLRITIGLESDNDGLLRALRGFIGAA